MNPKAIASLESGRIAMADNSTPNWLDWSAEAIADAAEAQPYYVYTSGIKDLKVKYRTFEPAAAIVTNPITIDGNVINVSLSAATQSTETSAIEYYVCFTDTPVAEDWIPILPDNDQAKLRTVDCELLFPVSTYQFMPLRFQADPTTLVVKKGKVIVPSGRYNLSNEGLTFNEPIDTRETYIASYTVDEKTNPNLIVIPENCRKINDYRENGQLGQVFPNGTDVHGSIYLAKTPYFESSNSANYSPVKVNLYGKINISDGGVVYNVTNALLPIKDYSEDNGSSPVMRNRTDYAGHDIVQLKAYDPTWENQVMKYPVFEYLQEGRRLVFTETFNGFEVFANNTLSHGNGKLIVNYKYMNVTFRAKIVLRNLYPNSNTTTPVLERYSLAFGVQQTGGAQ
jgi:hypothetical protein